MERSVILNKKFQEAILQGSEDQVRRLVASHGFYHTADGGYSLLSEVLRSKKFAIARVLITRGAQVNNAALAQLSHDTPLHHAIDSQQMDIAEMLLNRGADISAVDSYGETSIFKAISDGNLEFLELLYHRGVDFNATGPYGLRPLHSAAEMGDENAVRFLLIYGADINASSTNNKTALYFAAKFSRLEVVKRLLQFQPDVNNEGNKKALYAALFPERDWCETEAVNSDGKKTVVYEPVRFQYLEGHVSRHKTYNFDKKLIFETLIEYGFVYELEPGCNLKFFHGLVEYGFLEIVEDLLKYGADANMGYGGETPLLLATKMMETGIAELLVFYGADVNAIDGFQKTPIYYAAKSGNVKLFNILLANGATISDYPDTVLAAISGESEGIVEQLLNCGYVNINDCTHKGTTALHGASTEEMINILVQFGADIHARDSKGRTPLHIAAEKEYGIQVEALLEFGADVDSTDENGQTALHLACQNFDPFVVEILLDYGADIAICDKENCTPLDYALPFKWEMPTSSFQIFTCFLFHIVRMKTIKMYVSEKTLQGVLDSIHGIMETPVEEFTKEKRLICDEEIEELKAKKISNLNISYHELLSKNTHFLEILLRCDNIWQAFKPEDVKNDEFPIYAGLLKFRFRKAVERKRFVEQGFHVFGSLCHELPHLPAGCVEEIFQYLSAMDLQMLAVASTQSPADEKMTTLCEGEVSGESSDEDNASDMYYGPHDGFDWSDG